MSFKNIDFDEWVSEEWEESWVKRNFEETKYLFVVFEYHETQKQNPERELYFKGIKLWNMPMEEVEDRLKECWLDIQKTLHEGVKLEKKKRGLKKITANNLPSPGQNGLCHVRPKAKNAKDKVKLPDGQYITKQAFWLDREYIAEIIK